MLLKSYTYGGKNTEKNKNPIVDDNNGSFFITNDYEKFSQNHKKHCILAEFHRAAAVVRQPYRPIISSSIVFLAA